MRASRRSTGLTLDEVRQSLIGRLTAQRTSIEDAVLQRVRSISSGAAAEGPEYVVGLRMAVREAIDYAFVGIQTGSRPRGALPSAAVAQARRAAHSGVPLDTVLRRYHAADRLLSELIVGEAGDLPSEALQEIIRSQGPIVDHLVETIACEYMQEIERKYQSPSRRLGERVRGLLNGDRDRDLQLNYDLNVWHVGLIALGDGVEKRLRHLGNEMNCQILCVPAPDGTTMWGWVGSRSRPSVSDIERRLLRSAGRESSIALGEAHENINGWRLTHREALAAQRVLLYKPRQVVRCRDVILESAVLCDQTLADSLIASYLLPLDGRGDSGTVLRRTLCAYLKADQNVITTAHALEVDRKTVERRVRGVEKRLGQPLARCLAQIRVALAVEDLLAAGDPRPAA